VKVYQCLETVAVREECVADDDFYRPGMILAEKMDYFPTAPNTTGAAAPATAAVAPAP